MDIITGLIFGLFVGWLIGIIKAWHFKVYLGLLIILVVFSIFAIFSLDVASNGSYSYSWGWVDVAVIIGTLFGIWCGEVTYEEMKHLQKVNRRK